MFKLEVKSTAKLEVVETFKVCNPISSNNGTITKPPPIPKSPANNPVTDANMQSFIFYAGVISKSPSISSILSFSFVYEFFFIHVDKAIVIATANEN